MTRLCTIKPPVADLACGAGAPASARTRVMRGAPVADGLVRHRGERLGRIARHAGRDRQSGQDAQHRALSPLVWRAQSRLPVCRRWLPLLEH
jgi:hypothetical protein